MIDLQDWADALEFGGYTQTTGVYHILSRNFYGDETHKFCAVGVGFDAGGFDWIPLYQDTIKIEYGINENVPHLSEKKIPHNSWEGLVEPDVEFDLQAMGIVLGDVIYANDTLYESFADIAYGLRILDAFRSSLRNKIEWSRYDD